MTAAKSKVEVRNLYIYREKPMIYAHPARPSRALFFFFFLDFDIFARHEISNLYMSIKCLDS